MAKRIIVSPVAERSYEAIIDYLYFKWGEKVTEDFVDRFKEVSLLIISNTELYPVIHSEGIRRCVVTKHNIAYFREEGDVIYILEIFDTRQNPDKLDEILK